MKTLYFECNMGAAGDMLMAALIELLDDKQGFLAKLNDAGIPGVVVTAEPSSKCGITGTSVKVTVDGREESRHDHDDNHHHDHDHHDDDHHHHDDHTHPHTHSHTHHTHSHTHDPARATGDGRPYTHHDKPHHHRSYTDIEHQIGRLHVSADVKKNALDVYKLIAEAESHAHGVPVDRIHFHEVGEMDAIADIVGVCMLIEELAPAVIISSPINTGSGHVTCAHGILPVPAPATAHILQGIPMYSGPTTGELCTPTGAALLKHFVKQFSKMPLINVNKIGYGMGKKDFGKANCVRAYIGDIADAVNIPNDINAISDINDEVSVLICNLDDMTPESIAFAQELLFREGALDVWTIPIGMKKGRQGIQFSCLCVNEMRDKMISLIFKHTTTLGIRESTCRRYTLQREQAEVKTKYGTVRIKTAHGFGVTRSKPEYEDIAEIAREKNISTLDMLKAVDSAMNMG